ncbi:MAG TPA: hypothetical protein VFA49_06755, partial [Chloroflexota bacterium]|nr:hypothetical protein [Chloroflexota bacterium]
VRRPPLAATRRGRLRAEWRRHVAHPTWGGAERPPDRTEPGLRWRRGRPAYYGVEWPFWLLMLSPWLIWGALVLLDRLGACLICLR